ncbi:MAG TPA: hypothetical protein VK335_08645 [Bryobacteraceae bacterium]|nr:hypothetical protein [Bryobacteraceae bacterium]
MSPLADFPTIENAVYDGGKNLGSISRQTVPARFPSQNRQQHRYEWGFFKPIIALNCVDDPCGSAVFPSFRVDEFCGIVGGGGGDDASDRVFDISGRCQRYFSKL